MDFLLPATTYKPFNASERRQTQNTYIAESPQDTPGLISQFPAIPCRPAMASPTFQDDLPTPKASILNASRPRIVSPLAQEFDELYDVSESEEEEVPLTISASVKRVARSANSSARSSRRYPSIVIPSPSAWPTIQKLQKAKSPMSPARVTPLSPAPAMMSLLNARLHHMPAGSATPSLDGSMTSEELDKLSCPSTPDLHARREFEGEWDAPVQLGAEAMETLAHLGGLDEIIEEQVIEMPVAEMQQTGQLTATGGHFLTPMAEEEDPLSALSIPSPGGFFSSLGSSARDTWSTQPEEEIVPSTAAAENFYGLPWASHADNIIPQIVEIAPSVGIASGPPTARLAPEVDEVKEIQRTDSFRSEYNSNYLEELQSMAAANLDRTGDWLSAQQTYLAALTESGPLPSPIKTDDASTRSRSDSLEDSICSPSKKSVRFCEDLVFSPTAVSEPEAAKETVFNEAFEFINEAAGSADAFIHRQTRSDALHTIRRHMSTTHRNQLLGDYEIETIDRPAPSRPVSSFYPDDPTALKERIARAEQERQALEQIKPATWVLEAQKCLNGGKLLTSAAFKFLSRSTSARVLDIGGQAACDWAWQMCLDYPTATITTAVTSGNDNCTNLEAPINHKTTVVPNLWTLPFPSAHFDVISARSLYALLKTVKPTDRTSDEIDLCLKDCMRCLKPGGFLEFNVLDADLIHAGPLAQAMSVEFGFNLKTRGYDAALSKSFLGRLDRAGFQDVRRAWTFLPMGQTAAKWTEQLNVGAGSSEAQKTIGADGAVAACGTTLDATAVTGLVGSWAWERWFIKLQTEMGKPKEKLLEGVPAMIEECASNGAGWRTLNGWARKAF